MNELAESAALEAEGFELFENLRLVRSQFFSNHIPNVHCFYRRLAAAGPGL